MTPPVPPLDEEQARDIARRWGAAAGSQPLLHFGKTGLVGDRKRLAEAIQGIRVFLKHTHELDRLLDYIGNPCRFEAAARNQGWLVDDKAIYHIHDYDKSIGYNTWRECCEAEDIVVGEHQSPTPKIKPQKQR